MTPSRGRPVTGLRLASGGPQNFSRAIGPRKCPISPSGSTTGGSDTPYVPHVHPPSARAVVEICPSGWPKDPRTPPPSGTGHAQGIPRESAHENLPARPETPQKKSRWLNRGDRHVREADWVNGLLREAVAALAGRPRRNRPWLRMRPESPLFADYC